MYIYIYIYIYVYLLMNQSILVNASDRCTIIQ